MTRIAIHNPTNVSVTKEEFRRNAVDFDVYRVTIVNKENEVFELAVYTDPGDLKNAFVVEPFQQREAKKQSTELVPT